jgi:hypothetical protein
MKRSRAVCLAQCNPRPKPEQACHKDPLDNVIDNWFRHHLEGFKN